MWKQDIELLYHCKYSPQVILKQRYHMVCVCVCAGVWMCCRLFFFITTTKEHGSSYSLVVDTVNMNILPHLSTLPVRNKETTILRT